MYERRLIKVFKYFDQSIQYSTDFNVSVTSNYSDASGYCSILSDSGVQNSFTTSNTSFAPRATKTPNNQNNYNYSNRSNKEPRYNDIYYAHCNRRGHLEEDCRIKLNESVSNWPNSNQSLSQGVPPSNSTILAGKTLILNNLDSKTNQTSGYGSFASTTNINTQQNASHSVREILGSCALNDNVFSTNWIQDQVWQ